MSAMSWYQRMLTSTRGQLVSLLRRETRTVDELAQALDLTDNAVRAHLATLERDGLVQQQGVRRSGGSGKPAYSYALTADAERLFPKAYGPVLRSLLDVLGEQIAPTAMETTLHEVGRRLAVAQRQAPRAAPLNSADGSSTSASDDLATRLALAVETLNALGGLAELERYDNGSMAIHGYSCPLAEALPGHPEICQLAAALVAEVAGAPVQERCERGEAAHCCFVASPA
ncbi:MAG: ArsR family transcriptional regulator [Ktedonobacterales bacterium]